MRPQCVVILRDTESNILRYEFFFSRENANWAYRHAQTKAGGFCYLYSELGGFHGFSQDTIAQFVDFRDFELATNEDQFRTGFLNLSAVEIEEFAQRFKVPREIIQSLARAERDVAERRRYHANAYDERQKAIIRKYFPRFVVRWLFR
jgi:hypothetical protein